MVSPDWFTSVFLQADWTINGREKGGKCLSIGDDDMSMTFLTGL